jgi:uncharacterized membrane protein YphA (DoxX/SURF4 family)
MTVDRRRIIGPFAVFALVLLRLVIGWHFWGEGTKKLKYDGHDRHLSLDFSADDFLDKAKGPLADWYYSYVPDEHDWRHLLAVPRENVRPTPEQAAEQIKWQRDYNAQRTAAVKKGDPAPVLFPPGAPYLDWATQISKNWRVVADDVKTVPGLTDAQKQQVDKVLNSRLEALASFLAGEDEAMTAYRHELWRLENWRESPEAKDVPFYQDRIATKTAETTGQLKPWLSEVKSLEAGYYNDLQNILTPEQRKQTSTVSTLQQKLTSPNQARLDKLNIVVTILTIGVGACLLLGFFTRLASLAGAVFLLGVILSQPFWIPGTVTTISYCIEFAGLLVLAGTGAGRWLGLDFFTYAMFNRFRGRTVS